MIKCIEAVIRKIEDKLSHRINKITKDTMFNLLGMVIPILLGVATVPGILLETGMERFGGLSLLWLLVGYASLLDLGFGQALTKALAEDQVKSIPVDVSADRNWNTQWFLICIGLGFGLILWPLVSTVGPSMLHFSPVVAGELTRGGVWVAASIPFVISSAGMRGAIVAYHEFVHINLARTMSGALNFLVPFLIAKNGGGLDSMAIGLLLVRVFNWLYHFWVLHGLLPLKKLPHLPSAVFLRDLVKMAGWLTITNLANVAIVSLDRLLVGVLVSAAAIAYYSAPYDVLSKMWLIPNAITPVLFPILVKDGALDRSRLKQVYVLAEGALIGVMFPVCLALAVFAPFLLKVWLGSTFALHAGVVATVITVGFFINTSAHIPFTALQALGQSRKAALFQLIQVPIFCAFLTAGALLGGILGVAIAFAARMALDAAFFLIQGGNHGEIGRDFTIKIMLFVLAGSGTMLTLAFLIPGWWKILGAAVALTLFYPLWWRYLVAPHLGELRWPFRGVNA